MKETKLNPRQSPQKPPKPEMKSNQVFFGDRLNSEWKLITKWHDIMIFSKYWIPMFFAKVYITEHRRVSKEDIHNGNILLIGIVWHLSLKKIGDDYFSKASLKDTRLDIRIETRWKIAFTILLIATSICDTVTQCTAHETGVANAVTVGQNQIF